MLGQRRSVFGSVTMATLVLVPLVLAAAGCKTRPAEWSELRFENEPAQLLVVPQSNREVADLSPDDVIMITRQIGFTDDQILELGTQVRDALLQSGAARIVNGKKTEAILRVNGKLVFIRSGSRGSFIYDTSRGQFGLHQSPSDLSN